MRRSRFSSKTVEGFVNEPPTQEEVDRAKARILKNYELSLTNSQSIVMNMSEYAGDGDWRLYFLTRDEVKNVTPADVLRVAKAYLKSSNRTLGEFIPTKKPDRAEIAAAPDAATRFKDYKGGATISTGRSLRSDAEEHRGTRNTRQAAEWPEAGDAPEEDARRRR